MRLNSESAIKYAKELTITAMENEMIRIDVDPKDTAENVYEFFLKLYEEFAKPDE